MNESTPIYKFSSFRELKEIPQWEKRIFEIPHFLRVGSSSLIGLDRFNFENLMNSILKNRNMHHFFSTSEIEKNLFFNYAVDWLENKALPSPDHLRSQLLEFKETRIVNHSREKFYLNLVESYVENLNMFDGFASIVSTISDELVLNSIFNAPLDENNQPKYKKQDRNAVFKLEPSEYVDLLIGNCASYLYLCVSDRFGSLTYATLLKFLTKNHESKERIQLHTQGGGVGSYMVLSNASDILYSINEGNKTDILIRLPLCKSRKNFNLHEKSFNFCFKARGES